MRSRPTSKVWTAKAVLFMVATAVTLLVASVIAFAQAGQMVAPFATSGPNATIAVSWDPVAGATSYTLTYDTTYPFSATPHTVVTTNLLTTINGVDGQTYYFAIQADDGSGVLSPISGPSAPTLADAVPPVSSLVVGSGSVAGLNGWYKSATASISIVDTGTGGGSLFVNGVDVSLDVAWGLLPTDPSVYALTLAQGVNSFGMQSGDVAGNIETSHTATLKLDSVAPTCLLNVSTSLPTSVTVTSAITAADATPGSGVDHVEYVFLPRGTTPTALTAWNSVTGASAAPAVPEGRLTLFARSMDVAGNYSTVQSADVFYDKTAPVTTLTTNPVTATGPNGTWLHKPTLALSVVDADPAVQTFYSWNSTTVSTLGTVPVIPSAPGTQTLRYYSLDSAGNAEAVHVVDFFVQDQQTYTVTSSAGTGGSISPLGAQPVTGAANITFTIAPSTGFSIADVLVDGISAGPVTTYTFTSVTANHTISASFVSNPGATYTLTYTAGANGTITGTSPQTVNAGASGSAVTAVPNTGYHFTGWSDGVLTATRTDSNVNANISVTANFAIDTFTLTYTAGANGTITGTSPQTVNYLASGTAVTAVPNTGYHFTGWSDGVLTATRTDSAVTANISVTANFAINTFTLTYTAGANGTITGTSPQTVNYLASGTAVTAVPNTGYHFTGWSDGVLTATRTDSAVAANISVTANFAINTFTITPTAGPGGSISPATVQTVNSGANATFNIAASAGYHILDVVVDGTSVGAVSTYTFSNVTANHMITASFAIDTFTITPSAGLNGSISPNTVQTVNSGGSATFSFTPDSGYHVADVLVDNVSVGALGSYTFSNVTTNHTISVSFAVNPVLTFTITPSAGANGSISPNTAQLVSSGGSATFTIAAATGYHIADVLVDGVSVGALPSYTFSNVTTNHTISASFAIDTFIITPSAGANGSISPATAQTVNRGASSTFTIAAATGYHIANVVVDTVSVGATSTYTFSNVTANHTISASFAINTFTLTYTAGANGTISGTSPQTVNYNASGTAVTAVPNTGYHFTGWSDGVLTATRTDSAVTANISVTANFAVNAPVTFTITPSAGANGSISPATAQTVNSGGSATFTIAAATGYHIADVLVDNVSVGAVSTYTFNNVTTNHTISASFAADAPNTFSIVSSAGAHGAISPLGLQTVNSGATISFTMAADPGYVIADVLVDGVSVGATSTYTFSNVTSAHTISASFAPAAANLTIQATAGTGGSITPAGSVAVTTGSSASFVIRASAGYRISSVMVDGVSVGAVSSYTFSNVTADHTISASFVALRTTILTINPSTYNTTRGRTVTLRGTISPRMPNGTLIGVYVKKPGSSVYVRLSTRGTTSSVWSYSYKLTSRGYYYFQARFAGTSVYKASNSRLIRITVR